MDRELPTQLKNLLAASAARHSHLCPRQVLGVRLALAAAARLDIELPRQDKRLLVIVETDGCFVDGVQVATEVGVGYRTLRIEDYGKVAATFVDTLTGRAIRVVPQRDVRQRANEYALGASDPYAAQLAAYQVMPDDQMFTFTEVSLQPSLAAILSQPGARAQCSACGEEIINEREVYREGVVLCQACAGQAYYSV